MGARLHPFKKAKRKMCQGDFLVRPTNRAFQMIKIIVFVLTSIIMTSCATTDPSSTSPDNLKPAWAQTSSSIGAEKVIAVDLVSALMQIPTFDSWSMTVQFSKPSSTYGASLLAALTDSGYGIQKVSADQGLNYISYRKSIIESRSSNAITFGISLRGLSISRSYIYGKDVWIPASPMKIKGVEPTPVRLYDDLHFEQGNLHQFPSGVVFYDGNDNVINSTETNTKFRRESYVDGSDDAGNRFLVLGKANLFSRQRTESKVDNGTYTPISHVTLTFPTENAEFLGDTNKEAIAKIIAMDTDGNHRYLIQGCSHGQSLLWDGTESIALARQQRVNQELLVSGIDSNSIREKGCFATANTSELPKNSVLLTLLKRSENNT